MGSFFNKIMNAMQGKDSAESTFETFKDLTDIVKSLIIQSIQSRYKEQLVVELSKTN
ncbi:hypothetical protein [Suttonella ornithocola]|uniref:Uncharacterized protein n=1 Tax=Suttonella ornithocola TaxID=279832 RepID=A0A380MX82_9GAMM|nr:hypothetical protein [Suttonella ornithocola]SUO97185.1 Uncharacterised protein [Suttonella ornithocola]